MFRYLKNALIRGLVILIPAVLVYLALKELLDLMIALATPIAELVPSGWIRKEDPEDLIAILLIVLSALLLGVIWSAKPTRRAAEWLETRSLAKLPMYRIMKSLVSALMDLEDEQSFKPATWRHPDGSMEPVFVIGEHGADMLVVMQPWTPTPFAGSVKIVPADQVELVPVTLDEYSVALTHFGLGLSEAVKKREQPR